MVSYVFYDDTDCGGIVYHARYLVFCERARSLLFFENGMLPQSGYCGFVVQNIESNFLKTLQLGDMYKVKTTTLAIKNASLTLRQDVLKIGSLGKELLESELVFSMQVRLAHVDIRTKKACKITESLQHGLRVFNT